MKHLRRWGAVYIFFAMWMGTGAAHYHYMHEKTKHEAEQHGQAFSEEEFKNEWLSDSFENHQSEYAQLFFQSLLVIGFAHVVFKKEVEDVEEIKAQLRELRDRTPRGT